MKRRLAAELEPEWFLPFWRLFEERVQQEACVGGEPTPCSTKMFTDETHKTLLFYYRGWKEVISLTAWLLRIPGFLGDGFSLAQIWKNWSSDQRVSFFFTRPSLPSLPLSSFDFLPYLCIDQVEFSCECLICEITLHFQQRKWGEETF